MENFDSLKNFFNILKLSTQSIPNLHLNYICMLIISSWLCFKCTCILFYTTLILKACKINNRKKYVAFLRGGGGSPEGRPYDVPCGQIDM